MKRVWSHFHGRSNSASPRGIIDALSGAGVNIGTLGSDPPLGPGVLIFEDSTPALCNFIREASCNGRERILAVSLSTASSNSGVWNLLEAGASEVFGWSGSDKCAHYIAMRLARWEAVDQLLESSLVTENLIGQSAGWRSILRQIIEVAWFTDASILITGESGTGKELVARLIHSLDQRPRKRDLVVLDCTTVTPTLSGSEFFGHERGAFTGAVNSRDGAFALADNGTLFLDEIGELPLELQAQLLRVVQEKTFKRVGGNNWQKTDFRLVCATNRELLKDVKEGRFRNDLYYRIAAWKCRLPPLCERREDILPLARHFIQNHTGNRHETAELSQAVEQYLLMREYPGNIRDLKQLVTRIMYRHIGDGPITVGNIPEEERPSVDSNPVIWCDDSFEQAIRSAILLGVGLKEVGRTAEDTAIRMTLNIEDNNLQRAAKRLGVTDRALQLRRANKRQNGPGSDSYESAEPPALFN